MVMYDNMVDIRISNCISGRLYVGDKQHLAEEQPGLVLFIMTRGSYLSIANAVLQRYDYQVDTDIERQKLALCSISGALMSSVDYEAIERDGKHDET